MIKLIKAADKLDSLFVSVCIIPYLLSELLFIGNVKYVSG